MGVSRNSSNKKMGVNRRSSNHSMGVNRSSSNHSMTGVSRSLSNQSITISTTNTNAGGGGGGVGVGIMNSNKVWTQIGLACMICCIGSTIGTQIRMKQKYDAYNSQHQQHQQQQHALYVDQPLLAANCSTPVVVALKSEEEAAAALPQFPEESKDFSSVCTSLSALYQSASSPIEVWKRHSNSIIDASIAPSDVARDQEESLRHVLSTLTSPYNRLRRGSSMLSQDIETTARIVAKLNARIEYILSVLNDKNNNNNDEAPPPPVQIAVLGGSVTMGINCYTQVRKIRVGTCAWPFRLEKFLNQLGYEMLRQSYTNVTTLTSKEHREAYPIVHVQSLAVGGTNTATGTTLLELDMLAQQQNPDGTPVQYPDVLVNAYSTNDMHVNTLKDMDSSMTIRELIFDMAQNFIRTALEPKQQEKEEEADTECIQQQQQQQQQQPLLVWINDYLGNEQRDLLSLSHLGQAISVLSNYYGFGYVSYADAVRDIVYADTTETQFSPGGWYKNGNNMRREIHPQAPMHMAMTYLMSYHFFETVSEYCALSSSSSSTVGVVRKQPRIPKSLPPKITPDLKLDHISKKWNASATEMSSSLATTTSELPDCNATTTTKVTTRCPYVWIFGIPELTERVMLEKATKQVLTGDQRLVEWELIDDTGSGKKYGWMPMRTNVRTNETIAEPQITFAFEPARYRSFTVFFMKSYGTKWENSTTTITATRPSADDAVTDANDDVGSVVITGTHDKQTSETYTETFSLARPSDDDDRRPLHVTFQLVKGTTFKISGMAACQ